MASVSSLLISVGGSSQSPSVNMTSRSPGWSWPVSAVRGVLLDRMLSGSPRPPMR
jgi:hypothetical protein